MRDRRKTEDRKFNHFMNLLKRSYLKKKTRILKNIVKIFLVSKLNFYYNFFYLIILLYTYFYVN